MSFGDRKAVAALWQLTRLGKLVSRGGVGVSGTKLERLAQVGVEKNLRDRRKTSGVCFSEVNKLPAGRAEARSDSAAPFILPPVLDDSFALYAQNTVGRNGGSWVGVAWLILAREGF